MNIWDFFVLSCLVVFEEGDSRDYRFLTGLSSALANQVFHPQCRRISTKLVWKEESNDVSIGRSPQVIVFVNYAFKLSARHSEVMECKAHPKSCKLTRAGSALMRSDPARCYSRGKWQEGSAHCHEKTQF